MTQSKNRISVETEKVLLFVQHVINFSSFSLSTLLCLLIEGCNMLLLMRDHHRLENTFQDPRLSSLRKTVEEIFF